MSAGIDYGMGQTNIDAQTGYRYGVIATNSVMPEAIEDIYRWGEDIAFSEWCQDRRDEIEMAIQQAVGDYFSDRQIARIIEAAIEAADDEFGESYGECGDGDGGGYRHEADGYIIETTSLGLYVIRSPYVAKVRYCSPCCPGAGDLDSPDAEGIEAYALGPDWFDEHSPCPYAALLRRVDGGSIE